MAARRVFVGVLIALVALACGQPRAVWSQSPPPPSSTSTVAKAAESLRRSPVYVDPNAERALAEEEVEKLAARIRDEGQPVFVAVLPASAAEPGGPEQVVSDLARETGLSGTYAVVVGDRFRATSTTLANADELATAAFQARSGDGTFAVLEEFVRRAASEGRAPGSGTGPAPEGTTGGKDRSEGGNGNGGSLAPLALLAAGGGGVLLWSQRRRRRRASAERAQLEQDMASDRQLLRAQLAVLADDVMRLEPLVALHPEARNDYEAAVERYRIAGAALDYADEPIDLTRVQRVVEEAQYAMARARAISEGRTPPEPPADLRHRGRHQEPALDLDEAGMPHYAGGAPFYGGGWFGGGYGGGGGLFSGLLLGSILGGAGPFGMWGGNHIEINDYGDGGGSGGDGGGWGGGDLGGGDWGGGDFGGGDW